MEDILNTRIAGVVSTETGNKVFVFVVTKDEDEVVEQAQAEASDIIPEDKQRNIDVYNVRSVTVGMDETAGIGSEGAKIITDGPVLENVPVYKIESAFSAVVREIEGVSVTFIDDSIFEERNKWIDVDEVQCTSGRRVLAFKRHGGERQMPDEYLYTDYDDSYLVEVGEGLH